METPSFEDFSDFIRQQAGLSQKKKIVPETQFEDLGITGDDGCDLLQATENRFQVTLSSEEEGYRKTFGLGPNEFLFNAEGSVPTLQDLLRMFGLRPAQVVIKFTVGQLYDAVRRAMAEST